MKIEIEVIKTTFFDLECVRLTDGKGETLHIFDKEAISFFTSIK